MSSSTCRMLLTSPRDLGRPCKQSSTASHQYLIVYALQRSGELSGSAKAAEKRQGVG